MIFGVLLDLVVGIVLIVFGYLIWKKQKISLLHSYHYKNVKDEDKAEYCKQMGMGNIIIGVGVCLMGIFMYFKLDIIAWTCFALGFGIGILIAHKAQMKYNGSWLS